MEKDMEDFPIHHLQHGFTKGKSTESALSNTVNYIEEYLFDWQHCLGVFLDISSAFDSISIDYIKQKLLEHNGTPDMVNWYHSYLGRRYLTVELHGERVNLTTGTGFPQGGVCSAKFWLIAFDEAIKIINSNGITGNGYADDCSALVGGTHPHNMIEKMQTMLERLVAWGNTCGLRFNAQKTVVVMFSRSNRTFERRVRMNGALIPYSPTVVYLGITLDEELKWGPHVHNKIGKTKRLLMKLASITSAYWGPKPKLMKWAYTGIVRPAFTYGALVWAHAVENEDLEAACRRLNRQPKNTIVKVPRSTPTRAMEIILDIFPLHLQVLKEGLSAYIRLKPALYLRWTGVYTNLTYSVSHLRYWDWVAEDVGVYGYGEEVDECCVMRPEQQFVLDTCSFVDMENSQQPLDCNVYTDGSKLNDQVGAGVYALRKGVNIISHKIRLPDHATVYQAELMAIHQAANLLAAIPDLTTIKFFVDSQAALPTFPADFIKSKTALKTIHALNKIKHQQLVFVWTRAHVGTHGNEEADSLAKEGTTLTDITPVPAPMCTANNIVEQGVRRLWQGEWGRYTEARQSKIYHPKQNKAKAKITIQWNKLQLGRFIRATTGHNNLLYHLYNMDNHISETCRFCLEGREEFNHLMFDCPALWWERHTINAQDPDHSEPASWTAQQILDFTFFPRINEAFVKPLHIANTMVLHEAASQTSTTDNPDTNMDSDSEASIMDVSSLSDSSSGADRSDISLVSIE